MFCRVIFRCSFGLLEWGVSNVGQTAHSRRYMRFGWLGRRSVLRQEVMLVSRLHEWIDRVIGVFHVDNILIGIAVVL